MKTINKYIYITALICIAMLLLSISVCGRQLEANTDLQRQVTALQEENAKLNMAADLADEVIQAQSDLINELMPPVTAKSNRGGERYKSLGTYTITAYCPCEICCEKWAHNRPNGKVIVNGVELQEGVSVAAPLPLGTRLMIDGNEYVVQDRIAERIVKHYGGKVIDIYMTDHEAALQWGNPQMEVWEAV